MTIIAELKDVSKTFDGISALDKVNLSVGEGEILALLGPNGSGKTTLLRILAFILKPSNGEVHFHGTEITDNNIEQARMESTMVFQKTTLFSASVYDNVAYGLRIRKLPKVMVDDQVRRALGLVRLGGFEKRQAKKLSGGEQQRVALARAMALGTSLLLLDEPTANLDPKNASIVEEVIAEANREMKTTIIMATHNMFQAKNLPTRVALIGNGKLGEVGTPTEIFGRLSRTLASFAAVENTFTGEARPAEDGTTLINVGNGVEIVAATLRTGRVTVFVSQDDIILSKTRLTSSARNSLEGRVVEIQDVGSIVRLKVDVGKTFTVQITKRSFQEMGLNLSNQVFLAFKASSVQII